MSAYDAHKNFCYSTVATAPSPATSGLTLVVAASTGGNFPATPFNAEVWPANAQPSATTTEIIRVTNITGDTFTFTRTAEFSISRAIQVGDQIMVGYTAKSLTDIETGSSGAITFQSGSSIKRFTITDANVSTASKITFGVRRADIADVDDPGWVYIANIVTLANGSFDVLVVGLIDGTDPISEVPNESVTLFYHVWN